MLAGPVLEVVVVDPVGLPPPPQDAAGWSGPAAPARPRWVLPVVGVLLVAVVALTALAVLQRREVRGLHADLADARADIDELEGRVEALESGGGLGGLGGLLEQFLGEGGLGGLEGLFEDLPGGGLDDLLGGAGNLMACMPGAVPGGGEPVTAGDVPGQVTQVARQVEDLRGLRFETMPQPVVLASGPFEQRLRALAAEEYPAGDAALDSRLLAALGAVPPGTDMHSLLLDLVGTQAAGFYDDDTGDIVVRSDDPERPLGPAGLVTLAHELQHAAADQALGLPELDEVDADAARAALAIIEGDASLSMQHFAFGALDLTDQMAIATDPTMLGQQAELAGYPAYLQRDLVFPYVEGLGFACDLYGAGGWAEIDRAYEAPPTTTAQVLWPERHRAGEGAVRPADLPGPGSPWSHAREDTLGAADLLWLFSAPGDDAAAALDDPRERAAAWAGGTVDVWTNGDATAVGIALVQRPGEQDLCGSVDAWYSAAFDGQPAATQGTEALVHDGAAQDAVLTCDAGDVRLGIAPDVATARTVVG